MPSEEAANEQTANEQTAGRREWRGRMLRGKIVKGIGGFYYVHVPDGAEAGLYECRARGIFRLENRKPLVGDNVEMAVIDGEEKTGNLEELLPRENSLIRPAVANIDQALVIFAVKSPKPNLSLLDRFLLAMGRQKIPAVICFNKVDLASAQERRHLEDVYRKSGCSLLFVSAKTGDGVGQLRGLLEGKTTAVAGPSGAGKSSLVNALGKREWMQTGAVSSKIGRGRHTTRHSELIPLWKDTYIMDTPGFSSLYVEDMEKEELKEYMPEFYPYEGQCRFLGCTHIHEPGCRVKEALENGEISRERYESYVLLYEELKDRRRY